LMPFFTFSKNPIQRKMLHLIFNFHSSCFLHVLPLFLPAFSFLPPPSSIDNPSLFYLSSPHFANNLACLPVFFEHQSHMVPCRFFNFDFLFFSSFSRFFRGWHSTAMFFKKSNNNQKSSHSAHIQLLKGCEDLT
jgi:hypothetical protein